MSGFMCSKNLHQRAVVQLNRGEHIIDEVSAISIDIYGILVKALGSHSNNFAQLTSLIDSH